MSIKQMVLFTGKIIEATVTSKADEVDKWIQNIRTYKDLPAVVGLDCKRNPKTDSCMDNRTATLQLCVGTKCLIVQLFHIDYIPESLKKFVSDPNFTFVGVEVHEDVSKLRDEYMLFCTRTLDIQAWIMSRWPNIFNKKPGFKSLTNEFVGLLMKKPMHICTSNWENSVLSKDQIEYACIDAFACCRIGFGILNCWL